MSNGDALSSVTSQDQLLKVRSTSVSSPLQVRSKSVVNPIYLPSLKRATEWSYREGIAKVDFAMFGLQVRFFARVFIEGGALLPLFVYNALIINRK